MPSAIISNFVNKVNKNALIAFFSAMVSGVLTHLFIMTNKVFNYNEFSVLFLDKEEMTLGRMAEGRWFVGFIGQLIGDNYSMQMVTGIIGIMLLAVSAGMLVSFTWTSVFKPYPERVLYTPAAESYSFQTTVLSGESAALKVSLAVYVFRTKPPFHSHTDQES